MTVPAVTDPVMATDLPAESLSRSGGPRSDRRRLFQQAIRFAAIGVASTLAYALLYLALHGVVGAFGANFLALLLTAIANTAANRRLTFGVRGGAGAAGDHAVGLLAFGAGLALTSGALAGLHLVDSAAGRRLELAVLVVANAVATLLRFVVLRLRLGRTSGLA